jgi:DNA/RNA endonuclease G (NUC1)
MKHMKKIVTILLLILTTAVYGQKTRLIDKKIYFVVYSEKYQNPLSVIYKLYKPKSNVKRGSMDFRAEPGVITADNKDYQDNVYDKGHLAPAETFSDTQENLELTFSYLNCAVQHYKLNRGVWKSLEEHERQWAYTDSLLVINRVIFNRPLHPMKNGAYIPDYFEKSITFMSTGIKRVYRFPNVEPESKDIDFYLIKTKK